MFPTYRRIPHVGGDSWLLRPPLTSTLVCRPGSLLALLHPHIAQRVAHGPWYHLLYVLVVLLAFAAAARSFQSSLLSLVTLRCHLVVSGRSASTYCLLITVQPQPTPHKLASTQAVVIIPLLSIQLYRNLSLSIVCRFSCSRPPILYSPLSLSILSPDVLSLLLLCQIYPLGVVSILFVRSAPLVVPFIPVSVPVPVSHLLISCRAIFVIDSSSACQPSISLSPVSTVHHLHLQTPTLCFSIITANMFRT
ncbi:hypothetical protein L226DRAFT_309737 [Lentinus tigrinus ALCF2SS1-7]|uniref:Uncharacterized protein n=1 Tax=Lentinus tigrinus ALCF2SS1-6 TaxID=1328759 RepID=A0A5C2S910_9APHY|nr:hypothetical protein L227DRAFT_198558 [Lentinus tigrinus ALCF2SS1-6]RPD69050.1 hypothetical protein L226DRAFT_309737 [Lentinus tigrinus ALCF2SS1-7]